MEFKTRKNTRKKLKISPTRLIFTIVVLVIDVCVLYPVLNVLAVSFSSYTEYVKQPMMIFPKQWSVMAYKLVLEDKTIWSGYLNTIIITAFGTVLGLFGSILAAYSLSKQELRGNKIFMIILLITMFFSGGMIPNYFLIKNLHLLDTKIALIVPGCVSAYYIILIKNFFTSLPKSLLEVADLDGATEPQILCKIVIPLSKPIISVIGLFLSVSYWNSYFGAILYTRSRSKWTLQLVLREIIMSASTLQQEANGNLAEMNAEALPSIMLQYASIVVVMVPILCVYPFIQKYFQSGIMIGAVKG